MLGVILASSKAKEISLNAEFLEIGNYDAKTLYNLFQQASRLDLSCLVIDLDCALDGESAVLEGLHFFRIKRPNTRVVILAVGRKPGNITLSQIVALGIYDILTPEPEEDIQKIILEALYSEPKTYAQAARFIINKSIKDTEKQQEQEIMLRPPGLITIAIAGAGSGTGVSHLAVAIAAHLGKKNKVIIAEYPSELPSQYKFFCSFLDVLDMDNSEITKTKYFDILIGARLQNTTRYIWEKISKEYYDFLVFDLGALTPEKIIEMDRASFAILVVDPSPLRYEYIIPIIAEDEENDFYAPGLKNWILVLNSSNKDNKEWFREVFGKYIPTDKIVSLESFPDPLEGKLGELLNFIPFNENRPKETKLFFKKLFKKGV